LLGLFFEEFFKIGLQICHFDSFNPLFFNALKLLLVEVPHLSIILLNSFMLSISHDFEILLGSNIKQMNALLLQIWEIVHVLELLVIPELLVNLDY